MRIEKLEHNKIKISLTEMDFIHFDINREQLAMDRTVLHSFILRLMDKISRETDFNPYDGNIVVRATDCGEGMNIIISKVSTKSKYTIEELKRAKSVGCKLKNSEAKNSDAMVTYFFKDFENLCSALGFLDDEFIMQSEVYNYTNTYCCIATLSEQSEEKQEFYFKNISVLKEYSSKYTSGRVTAVHIKEQGKLIAKGDELVKMSEGIRKISG